MHLVVVGLSHHEAPIEVRERLNCAPRALAGALAHLTASANVREGVILSTCNRMEVYAVVSGGQAEDAYQLLTGHLAAFHQVPESVFAARLFHKSEGDAVSHLLRVASGLDSLVVGEPQIQGQVRDALRAAHSAGCCGPILDKLFAHSLATGKRARSETGLGQGGFSIGHAAVSLAQRILDDFARARVLILGAGKMSELTAAYLQRSGVQFVVVANRTYDKAVTLAAKLGGEAIQYDRFLDEMARADIVIASTSAPHPIVNRSLLAPVMKKRRGKPLFLIDIALPRDIDPDVNDLDNVYLRNIDDLQEIVQQQARGRESEVEAAESIAAAETAAFLAWMQMREAAPVIARLRSHLDQLTAARLEILRARLGPVEERQWQIIETQMRALTDQVALEPTRRLKRAMGEKNTETSGNGDAARFGLLEAACELFALPANPPDGSPKETISGDLQEERVSADVPSSQRGASQAFDMPRAAGPAFEAAPARFTGGPTDNLTGDIRSDLEAQKAEALR